MKQLFIILSTVFILSCQREKISKKDIIDDNFFLKNNGQTMPIKVAGNIKSNKFILIVHGGPGGTSFDYRDQFVKDNVESEFAVIYWDQRYAGYSQGNFGSTNINQFNDDLKKVILLVKKRYGNSINVYIMGHSWGGFLSPYFLSENDNQNIVKGWIQVDGAHDYNKNDSLTREMLIFYAKRELDSSRNTDYWKEVLDWCLKNNHKGRENATQLNQYAQNSESYISDIKNDEQSNAVEKKPSWLYGINLINSGLKKIDEQTYKVNMSERLKKINIPTYLMWGKYDFVCPPELIYDIKLNLNSSDVSEIVFSRSGHSPMVNEPNSFWNNLKNWVRNH